MKAAGENKQTKYRLKNKVESRRNRVDQPFSREFVSI